MKDFIKKYKLELIFSLIIILAEIVIFNFNSYRLMFSKYENKNISIEDCTFENLKYDELSHNYIMEDTVAYIKFNVNCKVGTVFFDSDSYTNKTLNYAIMYTDETSKNFRTLPSKILIDSIDRSKYTTCYLSGKSEKIGIVIYGDKGDNIQLNNIEINKNVPFNFNIIRVIILIGIVCTINLFNKSIILNSEVQKNRKLTEFIMKIICCIFVILEILISSNTTEDKSDVYSYSFAYAILNGHFYLENEPNDELLNLDNPYDMTQRNRARDGWDIALFDGKYYIYFGILPELILFVPYLAIRGTYLVSGKAVIIFSVIATIGIVMILMEILNKWFINLPAKLWILSEIILVSGSVIFTLVGRPMFYEVAVSAALAFCSFGILFAFKFFANEDRKYRNLLLASILLALAVACRPTALFISLIILPLIIINLIKNKNNKKEILKTIISVGIPYMVVGILLMIYNYVRFKNPFEFGAKYQLTMNDMKDLKYRILTLPVGIYTVFLKIPDFISKFPFIQTDGSTLKFFGYFYTEDNIGGLLMLVPTTFALIMNPNFKNKKIKYLVRSFTIVGFLISFISIMSAGVLQRYLCDYAWLLIIASLIIILTIYENYKSEEAKKICIKIVEICAAFTFVINIFGCGIAGEKDYMKNLNPDTYYNLEYTICFWE